MTYGNAHRCSVNDYHAIVRGQEGVKPRTLHRFADANATRTVCGKPTDFCVGLWGEADSFCEPCEGTSTVASRRRAMVADAWDVQVLNIPSDQWCSWRTQEPPWVRQLRPYFNVAMHQLTLMID